MLNFHLLKRLQVSDHIGPFVGLAGSLEAVEQGLAQDQHEKRAEDMAADRVIPLVEDGMGLEQGFGGPKQRLDLSELLVLERDGFGADE